MNFTVRRFPETAYVFGEEIEGATPDTIYVADLRTSEIFCFTGSSAVIWCLLEDTISDEDLVRAVSETFEEDEDVVREGTLQFVEELEKQNLLEFC